MTFSSQYGYVDLSRLPVISINGQSGFAPFNNSMTPSGGDSDIFAGIEKLAALQSRGILSEQEYASKKAELLSRL